MTQNLPALQNTLQSPGIPTEHELMVFQTMAKQAVDSKMYKGIGDQAGVMMIMLSARELGISPMLALNGGLNIINGKVEISARIMSGLIRKAGHSFSIKSSTDNECVLVGKRCDNGDTAEVSFSVADAQRAGLIKTGGGWSKFPKDMCFARALSRLARQLFSDCIGVGYVEGEIQPSDNVIVVSDVMEQDLESEFFACFPSEQKQDAIEYLRVVQAHFGWNMQQAMKELLKDKDRLADKFNKWREKR